MKKKRLCYVFLVVFMAITSHAYANEESQLSGNASVSFLNRYIFRGYEIGSNSAIIQPFIGILYKGFSASVWGNIDTSEHATQSFIPDKEGHKSFNETDLTLSYTWTINKLNLGLGYTYYALKYNSPPGDTEEVFLSAAYDTILKPTLCVYRDITSYPGTYVSLLLSHSVNLNKEITLDISGSLGYFSGSDDYWRTYESQTNRYTGKKYSTLHDGMIKIGLTFPIVQKISMQPFLQYWFPLSADAKRSIDGKSYNPNGKLDSTCVIGISLNFNF